MEICNILFNFTRNNFFHMAKVLGLDLGTNSLGWALADEYEQGYALLDKGVEIFQEGVARDKNNEKPAVQDRTDARALRRHYFRRRLRKIDLLRVLVRYDLCPPLTEEQLSTWRQKKQYPLDEEFLRWQRTDDNEDRNPYHDRYVALTERLDLENRAQRWLLGRAFYHLAQRRGFLSNRKEAGNEKEDGTVKESIKNLSAEMEAAGCRYLGEYFYGLYQHKERIRGKYTSRNEHIWPNSMPSVTDSNCPTNGARSYIGRSFSNATSSRSEGRSADVRSNLAKAGVPFHTPGSRSSECGRLSTTSG